jgi:hypothetical protein
VISHGLSKVDYSNNQ